ncbi:MAG: ATP-grasp domain-containing protein, partial [Gammaproteobacteria bacterium]|nr:ATP-grasp domain-containing protein [Gammaproteobacteria bacterium]
MADRRILIANRGEVALRVARSASELGFSTIGIATGDDTDSLHCLRTDELVELPGRGAQGYLDIAAVIGAASRSAATHIHPGWGFLSENATFAAACHDAGVCFVGPTPEQLALFGDKISARELATSCSVPVLPACESIQDVGTLLAFLSENQNSIIIKATAGGGGRGMRVVTSADDANDLLSLCIQEAKAAFGDGTVYAERYLRNARHIEVQVIGDGTSVCHLWERDCTIQRRHQKLIEIAPAPHLAPETRAAVLKAATSMANSVGYRGLGTFEFLVDNDTNEFFFIEANPRLQVEHTVTEAVLGLDLVALQLRIADGATLSDVGLAEGPPPTRGHALQLRINAEQMSPDGTALPASGRVTQFEPAAGPGVRVDTAAYSGYELNPAFDSLTAKLIVHHEDPTFAQVLRKASRAAQEFTIVGPATNLPWLRAIVAHPAFRDGDVNTNFLETHADALAAAQHALPGGERQTAFFGASGNVQTSPKTRTQPTVPDGATAVTAPLRANVVSIDVNVGDAVKRGQPVVVLEAMKMHHIVTSPNPGVIGSINTEPLATLSEGDTILVLVETSDAAGDFETRDEIDLDAPRADLDEVTARHALGLDENRPAAVARRRKINSRTARENVNDLCDPESFIEYGALTIAAQRRRRSLDDLMESTPADGMIAGVGTVNAKHFADADTRCAILAYDYTVLAGTQGHMNHKKKDRLFELIEQWKLPTVFFTEGGGGRPGDVDTDDLIMGWLDIKTFTTWAQTSGMAPRIALNSGRCFAGNAVIFGCADITIATANSNIGLAGPAMIEGGGLGVFTPEDIGPIDVQTSNGVVDIACDDEVHATAMAKQVLGYFQGSSQQWECADQRVLRHLIPENRLRVYDIHAVIEALADVGSVVELRKAYGVGMITAFVRIEGRPFGLIANNSKHLGGAIDSEGGEKGARFLQLCDTFGLPVISLCD